MRQLEGPLKMRREEEKKEERILGHNHLHNRADPHFCLMILYKHEQVV